MVPETELKADTQTIVRHMSHITRRWDEFNQPCLLEIVFLTAENKAEVRHVAHYKTDPDSLELAASDVAAMNKHRINAYATVNPVDANNRPKAGFRAKAEHIVGSVFQWADADDAQAAANIKNFVGPKCTFYVLTGTTPSMRPHVYWELDKITRDMGTWEAVQKGIAATLATDPVVTDPPRIMRLAGTINWPKPQKVAKGYIPELTGLQIYGADERKPVTTDQMVRLFAGAVRRDAAPQATGSFDIDTGPQAMDREQARIKALSGKEWNIEVFRLVGSYVRMGLKDHEIHGLTDPLTLNGFTVADTRDEVQSMIDRTRANPKFQDVEPYAAPQFDTGAETPPKAAPQVEWFDDIEPSLTDSYIVKGIIGAGTMSVVYGPSNSGKTFFVLDLAFHIAAGAAWRGQRVKQAAVLYLAAEGGTGVSNRIAALRMETGAVNIPLALRRAGMDLLHNAADLQTIYDLTREVQARGQDMPTLIVIDTLSRIMAGGDENSAADMTALIRNIDAIREATGAHIMLVHHTGKDTARGARGHSSLRAATDTEIEVQNEDDNRAAMVTKQRDYQGGETFAFSLKGVTLGRDQDGDEVTSCVVEWTDSEEFKAARKAAKGRGKNQQIIMETFDQMLAEGLGKGNPGGVGMPEAGQFWAVELAELRRVSQGKMMGEDTGKLFRQAWDALTAKDGIFVTGDKLAWRIDRRKK